MIAAAIVSYFVYAINGISAYAATCTYTYSSYVTDRRGQGNNLASCSSSCSAMWAGHNWRAVYNSTNRSCTCMVTNRNTATGTWQYAAYGVCGQRNECAITYQTCDTCANRSTVYTGIKIRRCVRTILDIQHHVQLLPLHRHSRHGRKLPGVTK